MASHSRVNTVLWQSYRGWILDGLAHESAEALNIETSFQYIPESKFHQIINFLGNLRGLFNPFDLNVYMHHTLFLKKNFFAPRARHSHVFVTHFDENNFPKKAHWKKLRKARRIICQNTEMKSLLMYNKIEGSKIIVACGAISHEQFNPRNNPDETFTSNYVLIVGRCKPRKNPAFLRALIDASPEISFLIHGDEWENYLGYGHDLPSNLQISEFNLDNHPFLIARAAALLVVSLNEGGPIPILEALASGTPVLSSNVGFAKDLLNNNSGAVLNLDQGVQEFKSELIKVISLKPKVRSIDLLGGKYSWGEMGRHLFGLSQGVYE